MMKPINSFVLVLSTAVFLTTNCKNLYADITEWVKIAPDGIESPVLIRNPSISGDARFIAFETNESLAESDTNNGGIGPALDIY